jgi:iron complex outermembrane recepter protein
MDSMRLTGLCAACGLAAGVLAAVPCAAAQQSSPAQTQLLQYAELQDEQITDLAQLSIEELSQLRVTSVSLGDQPLNETADSVFVITHDDMRRSGATSLPEVLRLAPNLQVARDDSIDWSITARGSGNFGSANKLLVQIDGRSVYHPAFSGVFWDAQHRMLEDLDRIEVISGPGGTLYGANAVNGVINIFSRDAFETQGWLASGTLGDVDNTAAVRWGGVLGEESALRVFATGYQRGAALTASGAEAGDEWDGVHGGFRFDWRGTQDSLTVQSDGHANTYEVGQRDTNANVIVRWRRELGDTASIETQAYWDQVDRNSPTASDIFNAYDVRTQINTVVGGHTVVGGVGYRSVEDSFNPKILFSLIPARRRTETTNVFVQDEIDISERATLTLGVKLEHETFTDKVETLPTIRLAWQAAPDQLFWAAVQRAVRLPNRFDRDLDFPPILSRNTSFQSEELVAYEAGYRGLVGERVSLEATAFFHDYDHLRTIGPADAAPTFEFRNDIEGERWGLEVWSRTDITDWWRASAGFFVMNDSFNVKPGAVDLSGGLSPGADANYQLLLGSQFSLAPDVELDIRLRRVDEIDEPAVAVPAYTEADVRLGWRLEDNIELFAVGQNVLDESHPENRQAGDPIKEARRRFHVGLRWRS